MSRAEAFEMVRQRGGTPSPAVTKRTQVLIVGELGWPLLDDGRPSNKLSRPWGSLQRTNVSVLGCAKPADLTGRRVSRIESVARQLANHSRRSLGLVRRW